MVVPTEQCGQAFSGLKELGGRDGIVRRNRDVLPALLDGIEECRHVVWMCVWRSCGG